MDGLGEEIGTLSTDGSMWSGFGSRLDDERVDGEDGSLSTGSFGEDRNIAWSRSGASEDGWYIKYEHRPDDWSWGATGGGDGSSGTGSGGGQE